MPVIGVAVNGKLPPPERKERLALNIFDLTRCDPTILQMLLSGNLDTSGSYIIADRGKVDERGVILTCNLEKAAAICDIIRNHDRKVGDYPTRVYVNRGGETWTRITVEAQLTLAAVDGDKRILNPALFGSGVKELAVLPAEAPLPTALTFEEDE